MPAAAPDRLLSSVVPTRVTRVVKKRAAVPALLRYKGWEERGGSMLVNLIKNRGLYHKHHTRVCYCTRCLTSLSLFPLFPLLSSSHLRRRPKRPSGPMDDQRISIVLPLEGRPELLQRPHHDLCIIGMKEPLHTARALSDTGQHEDAITDRL